MERNQLREKHKLATSISELKHR